MEEDHHGGSLAQAKDRGLSIELPNRELGLHVGIPARGSNED
jgi:hypothetical protein